MGAWCTKQLGQGQSQRTVRREASQIEVTRTSSGRRILRVKNPRPAVSRARSRSRKEACLEAHIDTAEHTRCCYLGNMLLREFPKELERIAKLLRTLDLSNNRLHELPALISQFSMLKSLNCDDNRIDQVSDELYKLKRLETLNLGNNRIQTIPPTIGALTALRTINLAGNGIESFPMGLTQCRHLNSVNLARNKISRVPQGMDNFQAMELNLNQNQISSVDKSIAKCANLKVLRLEENCLDISSFPSCILSDSNISTLTLDGNLFTMKQFGDLPGYEDYMERYTATKKKMI